MSRLPQPAAGDQMLQVSHRRRKAVSERCHMYDAGRVRRMAHHADLAGVEPQRLFAYYVFASLRGRDGDVAMRKVRRGDDHGIDFRIRANCPVVRSYAISAPVLSSAVEQPTIGIAGGHQTGTRVQPDARHVVVIANGAGANNRQSHALTVIRACHFVPSRCGRAGEKREAKSLRVSSQIHKPARRRGIGLPVRHPVVSGTDGRKFRYNAAPYVPASDPISDPRRSPYPGGSQPRGVFQSSEPSTACSARAAACLMWPGPARGRHLAGRQRARIVRGGDQSQKVRAARTTAVAGALCRELLNCRTAAEASRLAETELASRRYAGANFVALDALAGFVVHGGDRLETLPLGPGLHLLTNGDLNDPRDARQRFARELFLAQPIDGSDEFLKVAPRVCATGPDPVRGTTIVLRGDNRGTVSSTLVALTTRAGDAAYRHAAGPPDRTPYEDYSPQLREVLRDGAQGGTL